MDHSRVQPLPLVSICIPTFNGAEYLEAALSSVIAQTHKNIEVIFSDDGSIDRTLEIIARFVDESLLPVKVLHHRHTSLAGNWNNCVAHANGHYIKFLFQDDMMREDCVSKLVAIAESDGMISLAFSCRNIICEGADMQSLYTRKIAEHCGNLHAGWSNLQPLQDGRDLLADPALIKGVWNKFGEPSIVLIRRQCLIDLGGFDPDLSQLIDLDMWYRLCAIGKVAFVNESLSSFRVHQDQLSVRNAKSGEASNDSLTFARKVINASYFTELSDETQRRLKPRGLSPVFKSFRKHVKKRIKDIFTK